MGKATPSRYAMVGGKAPACRLAAFDDASGHLVNDLVGGMPVSVADCNITYRQTVATRGRGDQDSVGAQAGDEGCRRSAAG
jgi:hypothetical protein